MTKKSIQLTADNRSRLAPYQLPITSSMILPTAVPRTPGTCASSHSAIVSWSRRTAAEVAVPYDSAAVRAQHAYPFRLGRSGVADHVHRRLQVAVRHAAAVRPQRVEGAVARRPQVVELEAQLAHELADVHVPGVDELAAGLGHLAVREASRRPAASADSPPRLEDL